MADKLFEMAIRPQELSDYEQKVSDYQRSLRAYERELDAYNELYRADPANPALAAMYESLTQAARNTERQYDEIRRQYGELTTA